MRGQSGQYWLSVHPPPPSKDTPGQNEMFWDFFSTVALTLPNEVLGKGSQGNPALVRR